MDNQQPLSISVYYDGTGNNKNTALTLEADRRTNVAQLYEV